MLSGQYLHRVLRIEYDPRGRGAERLRYWVDEEARRHLEREVFGKRIVITNRDYWSTPEILLAYRGQSHVEGVFRQLKDDQHFAVRPQYHWTDHKIQVHAFICLLALLLGRVVEREARAHGYKESLSRLMDRLGDVRLAMVLQPSGKRGGSPRAQWQLEAGKEDVCQLFRSLVPDQPPFVYTGGTTLSL